MRVIILLLYGARRVYREMVYERFVPARMDV